MAELVELPPVLLLLLSALVVLIPIFNRRGRLPPCPIGIPIIGHFHLLSPLLHRSFADLSRRMGPLFSLRLGSVNCVVASSPELAREFLKTHELSFSSRIDSAAINRLTYASSMAFAPHDAYWKFIRKLTMNELLGNRPVNSLISLRTRELHRFMRVLADKSERREAVNISAELPKMTYAMIFQMVCGSTGATSGIDRSVLEEARTVARDVTKMFGELNLSDFVWILKKLDFHGKRLRNRVEEIFRRFDTLIERVLREREELRRKRKEEDEEEVKNRDFLDILLDHLDAQNDENVQFTRLNVKGLIIDLFTAGTDSTAAAIEWMLSELINNPMVLKKAREEINRVVGKTRLVNESDGPNLPYIQAIIRETLRLHPVSPVITRKCVEDCKVGKYMIPKDAILFVNNWAISRNPQYWHSPLEFRPERFLHVNGEGSKTVDVRGQHYEVLPFGSGRRMCPGYNLVLQMLPIAVAAIIQCFDLKVVDSLGDKKEGHGLILDMQEGPGLSTPRLNPIVCVPVASFSPLPTILGPEIE